MKNKEKFKNIGKHKRNLYMYIYLIIFIYIFYFYFYMVWNMTVVNKEMKTKKDFFKKEKYYKKFFV